MKQYQELLKTISEKGTYKPAARENMPGTKSLFGYQFRHDLSTGFPLLTTKKMFWKGVVIELLWFLRGDTNIKYLVDNGVNIWNEDAYNYYVKNCKDQMKEPMIFDDFIVCVKDKDGFLKGANSLDVGLACYIVGDCGNQYGKVWRHLENEINIVDQIKRVIESLNKTPESRRHIVSAIDPLNDHDLALYWCHALFQFNCRPLTTTERAYYAVDNNFMYRNEIILDAIEKPERSLEEQLDENNIPKYYLDCQLYQRSADVVLGVPFNIASYALLTHLIAKICNMIPGEFIHTFGDVHIYDNHNNVVIEQLTREPTQLPKLIVFERHKDHGSLPDHFEKYLVGRIQIEDFLTSLSYYDFRLIDYNPQASIKAELSTGLKK